MSPPSGDLFLTRQGFPRVSGDEPLSRVSCMAACMFSPRERG